MARARLLKPGFFSNELLAELPFEGRLLFQGLWVLADREGRLEDRPARIAAAVFPYDKVDVASLLVALEGKGFIVRYLHTGMALLQIAKFSEHQTPHHREPASMLPAPSNVSEEESPGKAGPSPSVYGNGSSSVSGNGSLCTEPRSAPFLEFPTVGRPHTWGVSDAQMTEWQALYPNLTIKAEVRQAKAWIDANPGRRKTAGGMSRFLVNWFARSVERRSGEMRRPAASLAPTTSRYVIPCPHQPTCRNTGECCRKQDREAA